MSAGKDASNRRLGDCKKHRPTKVYMPGDQPNSQNQREDILTWHGVRYTRPVPFICYADFECFLGPPTEDDPADVVSPHVLPALLSTLPIRRETPDRHSRPHLSGRDG